MAKRAFFYSLIIVLSLALRLYALGRSSYWIDEMVSVHFAKIPGMQPLFWDNSPILYPLLLKGWVSLFGDNEVATRFLSVIFSTSTTAILIICGNLIWGFEEGCVLGLFHALSPFSVYYAQETRMYSLIEMLTTLNLFYFYKVFKKGQSKLGYAFSAIGLALTHYLCVIPLAIQGLTVLILRSKSERQQIKILATTALCFLIALISYLNFFSTRHLSWQMVKFQLEPTSHWPLDIFWSLLYGSWFSIIGILLLLIFFAQNLFKKLDKPFLNLSSLLLVWTISPIIIFTLLTLTLHRSMLLPRYFIYILPYFITWVTLVFLNLLRQPKQFFKVLGVTAFLLVFVGAGQGLKYVYLPHKAPWREVAATVSQFPKSYVLTTRTESIKTPYFERIGVEVEKVTPDEKLDNRISELLAKSKNVWIIETYWTGLTYFKELKTRLEKNGLSAKEYTVKNDYSEPVFVMLVRKY